MTASAEKSALDASSDNHERCAAQHDDEPPHPDRSGHDDSKTPSLYNTGSSELNPNTVPPMISTEKAASATEHV